MIYANIEQRIHQTTHEINRLQEDLHVWFRHRDRADRNQQYTTQLGSLYNFLTSTINRINNNFINSVDSHNRGKAYSYCRKVDYSTIWLRRIWQHFQMKFDQRDDSVYNSILAAADEIVWSCYANVFRHRVELTIGPPPLPYIESLYSPQAFPRVNKKPPPSLYRPAIKQSSLTPQGKYEQIMENLPIPLVSIPPQTISEPWWIIFLGHEVGHHIQYELGIQDIFGIQMKSYLSDKLDLSDVETRIWFDSSKEIFADMFSILNFGSSAIAAIAELEFGQNDLMFIREDLYPSPVIRLKLMIELASALGIDVSNTLGDLMFELDKLKPPPDLKNSYEADLRAIPCIVDYLLRPLPNYSESLVELCRFNLSDHKPGGAVDKWKRAFRSNNALRPEKRLETPRYIFCGAMSAWREVLHEVAILDSKDVQSQQLWSSTLETIVRGREDGTRVAIRPDIQDIDQISDQFIDSFLNT